MLVLPLRRLLLVTAVLLFAAAAALFAVGVWVPMPAQADRGDLALATAAAIAAVLFVMLRILYDRDKELLVRSLVDASQRAAVAETAPLPQLRVLQGRLAFRSAPRWLFPALQGRVCGG